MNEKRFDIVNPDQKELKTNPHLVRQLLDFAATAGFTSSSEGSYLDEGEVARIVPVPDHLKPLLANYPYRYNIVYYTNRLNSYYKEGTRFEHVGLSTVNNRKATDEKIEELTYGYMEGAKEPYLKVGHFVGQKDFLEINEWNHMQDTNHGSGVLVETYQLGPDGSQSLSELRADRVDETTIDWQGRPELARLVRDLTVTIKPTGDSEVTFEEAYLIGWRQQGGFSQNARVRGEISGKNGTIDTLRLRIGMWDHNTKPLFSDPENHLEIVYTDEKDLALLTQEPSYSFLFERPIQVNTVIARIKEKIQTLYNDWDKPQSIFSKTSALEATKPALGE